MPKTLLPPAERAARTEEKRRQLLRFLMDEVYTSPEIVGLLLNLNSRQAINKTLMAMERDGLLARHSFDTDSGWSPTLWGITQHGQGMAFDPEIEEPRDNYFQPYRVALSVLRHTLDLQRARVMAERVGWSKWCAGDRAGKWEKGVSRPDAVATGSDGERVAFEIERTFKTPARYLPILVDRTKQIQGGLFTRCVWLTPTDAQAASLKAIFQRVIKAAPPGSGEGVVLSQLQPGMLSVKTYQFFDHQQGENHV